MCLDLGELHQVLLDEELARRLQKEEEKLLTRVREDHPTGCTVGSHPAMLLNVAV